MSINKISQKVRISTKNFLMNSLSNFTVLLCFYVRLLGYHTSASLLPGAAPEIPTANSPTAIPLTNELNKYVFVSAGKIY